MTYVYENPVNVKPGTEIYVKYLFDQDGRRNILKKNNDGSCCFLLSEGCVLPQNVRPLVCRLYPYDWNDNRDIWLDARYCPKDIFKDDDDMLEHIGLPKDEAKRLIDLFYYEIMNQ